MLSQRLTNCRHSLWVLIAVFPQGAARFGAEYRSLATVHAALPYSQSHTVAFRGGHWWVGNQFIDRAMYATDGIFRTHRPLRVDTTIDLHRAYIIPPFGDAHAHHFDSPRNIRQIVAMDLNDGIFYGMSLTNSITGKHAVSHDVNTPLSMNVAYSDAGITASYGHPTEVYEALALGLYTAYGRVSPDSLRTLQALAHRSHQEENDAYVLVDSAADIDRKWPALLASHPDIIKIFLVHSERFDSLRRDTAISGNKGLNPALVPLIVQHAHAAGLRVAAHVDSPHDFRTAVAAGVDVIAHMPGYEFFQDEDAKSFILADSDVALAAHHHVTVIPTASLAAATAGSDSAWLLRMQDVQRHNLATLRRAGVAIAIGSDHYGVDARTEALYLRALGGWTNSELLDAWTRITPALIFPQRKIGRLADGYEASFLALAGNPIADFTRTGQIVLRVKQGEVLPQLDSTGPLMRAWVPDRRLEPL